MKGNKRKEMQKKINTLAVAAAVVAIAVVAAILALTLGKKEEVYRSIKIIELEGGVTIDREGVGILEASNNMNLISGDSIQTEQDAYAVLQLDSDKYVMLAESGRMTVIAEGDEANGKTAIHLDAGSVLNEIQNPLSSGSSYDVVTPNATMSVRGTVFEVRKNEEGGNIEVLVYDGKVAVGFDDGEPALYEAGEYTQFTAGENPQFIIERTEITEDVLNEQVLERLEQINSQSRELNLGAAQLASARIQDESVQTTPVPEATAKPVPTVSPVQPAPSAAPNSGVAAVTTPAPAKTPQPQVSNAGTVQETPAATSPEPEDKESNDDWDDEDRDSHSGNVQHPEQKPDGNQGFDQEKKPEAEKYYQDFWKTYDYQAAETSPEKEEYTAIFYLPCMAKEEDGNGFSTLQSTSPKLYSVVRMNVGSLLIKPTEPAKPEGYVNDNSEKSLTFVGWCLEGSINNIDAADEIDVWDFDNNTITSDICLYPVWQDDTDTYYCPVICRSEESGVYYCNSVKVGSRLAEISFDNVSNHIFAGWKSLNRELEGEYWDFDNDVVKGVESLKASWVISE